MPKFALNHCKIQIMINYKTFQINTLDKAHIHLSLKPEKKDSFQSQLDNLLEMLDHLLLEQMITANDLIFAKIFVSDLLNQKKDMETHPLFQERFRNCGISIIEQPPLDGTKINLLLWFIKGENINKYKLENAFYLETTNYTHLFHSPRYTPTSNSNPEDITQDLFEQHKTLLQKHNMSLLDNCLRTWLYVKDIDKDYSLVVKGRNRFFEKNGLTVDTHFITSTGIEGSGDSPFAGMGIDLYSIKGINKNQINYLKAENYLSPTYKYGVAFERGVSISYPDVRVIFISGTASIDKLGNCIHTGDVIKQLQRTFINIEKLLEEAEAGLTDISQMIVYIRDVSDRFVVEKYISENFNIPYVIVLAKVCRPEWLIEVECIALKKIE